MANNKDVNLVVRARDEANKTLKEVAASLRALIGEQEDLAKSAAKTDSVLSALGREYAALNKEIAGLTAIGKVAREMDTAAQAITRLEKAVARSKAEARDLTTAYGQASQFTAGLRKESDAATAAVRRQNEEINKTRAAIADLRGVKTPAARSFLVFEQNELNVQRDTLRQLKPAAKEAEAALKAAAAQQSKLRRDAQSATTTFNGQRKELGALKAELIGVTGSVGSAQAALGGVALNQDQIASRAKVAAAELEKVTAALERQKKIGRDAQQANTSALPQSDQLRSVFAARQAFLEAQAQVAALGRQIKATQQPTDELRRSYVLAQEAVKAASVEYEKQIGTLNRVGQAARGSFAEFERRAQAIQRNTNTTNASVRANEKAASSTWRLRDAVRGLAQAHRGAETNANRWAQAIKKSNDGSRQALSFTQRLRGELISLATAYVGFYGAFNQVSNVVDAFRTVEAVENRLGGVFQQDTNRVAQEVRFLRSEAIRLGISFQVLGDEYSKLSVATNQANFTQDETRKLFLSVAEAGRVNKLSVEQLRGIFLALQQMVSKGKITAEELTRQLGDRLPGAAQIMADALDVSTAELFKMMRAGDLLANRTNMLAFADALNQRFGAQLPTALESLTTQIGRFQAIMFDLQAQVAEAGFAENLRLAINGLNKSLSSGEAKNAVQAISDVLSGLVQALVFVIKNFDLLAKAVKIFLTFKLAQVFVSITASVLKSAGALGVFGTRLAVISRFSRMTFAGLAAQTGAARTGMLSLAGAATIAGTGLRTLAALGRTLAAAFGPVGIAFVGLSVVMELIGSWTGGVDTATKAVEAHIEIVQKAQEEYSRAKNGVVDWAKTVTGLSKTQIKFNTVELQRELDDIRRKIQVPMRSPQILVDAINAFHEGTISAKEFKKVVDDLAENDKTFNRALANSILDIADKAAVFEEQIAVNNDLLAEMDGLATKTGDSFRAMNQETGGFDTTGFEEAEAALRELKDLVPDLGAELKRLNDLAALDKLVAQIEAIGPATLETFNLIQQAREAINREAIDKVLGGGLIDKIVSAESGGNASAKNPNSSATGLGQFIESTWIRMFKQYFPDRAAGMTDGMILALRENAELSRKMVELYAAENAKVLQDAGVAVNEAAVYLAHFLGPGGALKVLTANPNQSLADLLSSEAIDANQSVLGGDRTAADLIKWAQEKISISQQELAVAQELQRIDAERAENTKKFLESERAKNEELEFQIANARESARQQAINQGLREFENEAQRIGIQLTEEQIRKRRELLGLQYDAANAERIAAEDRQRVEDNVNMLLERRRLLLEQIEFAQNQGDATSTQTLLTELTAVDTSLSAAIEKAILFWEAIGGEDARNKILALESLRNSITQLSQLTEISGKRINDSLVEGGASALDRFAEAVANGQSAVSALRDSFLQFAADFLREIAQMIIKQALLNALTGGKGEGGGGGIGGFIATAIGALFHSGGIAGRSGPSRRISPGWFQNAVRYHTGGIAGLKPNEVPAILEKGEEILTENDPRHIMNGGGAAAAPNIKVVNAIDAGSFISEGLNSSVGESALLNYVRANSTAVKQALGV